jgi:hypothetical protein
VNLAPSPSPFSNLSVVILALRKELGGWGLRGFLSTVLVLLVYRRLGEIVRTMEGMAARFRAGTLRRVVGRASGAARAAAEGGRRVWPGRFGWLVRAASWQAAGYGCQLEAVLRQPEMVALLLAAPQAARVLRPVCRALAIDPALLRPLLPGEVAPAAPVREVKPRVRKPRPKVDWGRIPLPRGVLAAARRQGFGKIR